MRGQRTVELASQLRISVASDTWHISVISVFIPELSVIISRCLMEDFLKRWFPSSQPRDLWRNLAWTEGWKVEIWESAPPFLLFDLLACYLNSFWQVNSNATMKINQPTFLSCFYPTCELGVCVVFCDFLQFSLVSALSKLSTPGIRLQIPYWTGFHIS